MTKAGEILDGKGNEIWGIRSDQSVFDAIKMMAEKGVGALLVIDDHRLSGIISERDYARKVILKNRSSHETRVNEIMTRNVYTTTRETTVSECMALMTDHDFRHLPVVENEEVLGIITIGDLVKTIIREQQFTIDQLEHYITG